MTEFQKIMYGSRFRYIYIININYQLFNGTWNFHCEILVWLTTTHHVRNYYAFLFFGKFFL